MISLLNTTRMLPDLNTPRMLLHNVTDQFRPGDRVGILATPGSGKSSLARLLAGIEPPDRGHVVHKGQVSWPIGFAGLLHPELTGVQNLDVLATTLGRDPEDMIAFCAEFSELGSYLDQQMKTYSPVMRIALAFSVSMSVPFGMYIADEVVGYGDTQTRAKCEAMLDRRLTDAGLVFLSKNPNQLTNICTSFRVLTEGALIPCPDIDVAQDILNLSLARMAEQKGAML